MNVPVVGVAQLVLLVGILFPERSITIVRQGASLRPRRYQLAHVKGRIVVAIAASIHWVAGRVKSVVTMAPRVGGASTNADCEDDGSELE